MNRPVRLPSAPTGARALPGGSQAALDRWIEAAREQGRAEGRAAADAAARDTAVQALERAADALERARAELLPSFQADVAWLASEIARHLLRVELDEGRYDLEAIVRGVLEASGAGRCACTVHLHPDDAAALEGVRFRAGTTIDADVEVSRGDVHVTTPRGTMVREAEAALEGIREALRAKLS